MIGALQGRMPSPRLWAATEGGLPDREHRRGHGRGELSHERCDPSVGSLRLITLPNFWGHANCDPQRIAEVCKATSEQDWTLCENNHAGITSLAYEPGPFSEITEISAESLRPYSNRILSRRRPKKDCRLTKARGLHPSESDGRGLAYRNLRVLLSSPGWRDLPDHFQKSPQVRGRVFPPPGHG